MKKVRFIMIMFVAGLLLSACGDDETGNGATLTDITVTPSNLVLKTGDRMQLIVEPVPIAVNDAVFAYSSDNESVATVSNSGAIAAISEGKANISVSCGAFKKTVPVEVSLNIVAMTDILLMPSTLPVMEAGDSLKVTAIPLPDNTTEPELTWSSSDEAVATVVDGLIKATGKGKATITVSNVGGNISKALPLTVKSVYIGQWLFDDATDLGKASIGKGLTLVQDGGDITSVEGPTGSDKAVRIPLKSYLLATNDIEPNGADNGLMSQYTVLFDVRIPAQGKWYAFMQTDLNCLNTGGNDAILFISKSTNKLGWGSQPGKPGYADYIFPAGEWKRVVMTVDNRYVKYYIDGEQKHSVEVEEGTLSRLGINPLGVAFFGDNDGDDGELDVAQITLWNIVLTADAVQALGRLQ